MAEDTEGLNINISSDSTAVEQGSQRAKASIKGVGKEARDLDVAFRRLKSAIDPTFAATDRYNKTLADNQRLLKAGRISQEEYAAGVKVAKAAMDAQIQSLSRLTTAGKAAAAESKRQSMEAKISARETAEIQKNEARLAAAEKINAAKTATAAILAAQEKERTSIKLSAQVARQAAAESRRLAASAVAPSTRGVKPGSIETNNQSINQLAANAKRAAEVAERAAIKAMAAAAAAAESTSARTAAAAQKAAEKSKAAAEDASNRAIQLARAKASEEGRLEQEVAAVAKAAREQEKRAIQGAAAAAKAAAADKRKAGMDAAKSAREAAKATDDQAKAEKRAAAGAQELRASIDPVFAAQTRYNETMRTATTLLMQNKLQTGEWTNIQRQAKAQMDVNVRSMGRMNSVYVQMGYQAQDVTASLASGISPLVILAQQGGQTASALAQMGGTVGKVAAFFAGPWGAAIIGFTLLIGLMIGKEKEAKEATLDLSDAEARRAATLPALTKALEDFNAEQERANVNSAEALRLASVTAAGTLDEATGRVVKAQNKLAELNANLTAATAYTVPGSEGAIGALMVQINSAQKDLAEANKTYGLARTTQTNVEIRQARSIAEATVDAREAIRQQYDKEETALQNVYKAQIKVIGASENQAAKSKAQAQLTAGLVAAQRKRDAGFEAVSESKEKPKKPKDTTSKAEFREAQEGIRDYIEELEYKQSQEQEDFNKQLELQDQKIAALSKFYGATSKETVRAQRERLAIQRKGEQDEVRSLTASIEQKVALAQNLEERLTEAKSSSQGMLEDNANFNQQQGLVSPQEAVMEKARLLDMEYQDLLAHEQRMYQATLKGFQERLALAHLLPVERDQINRQVEALTIAHETRLSGITAGYARQVNQTSNEMAAVQSQRWREVASTLTSSMGSAFQGLWTKQITFQQAFVQMADQLVYKAFEMGQTMLQDWIMSLIQKRAETAAAAAAEKAIVQAAALAQKGIVIGSTVAETAAKMGAAATEGTVIAATTKAKIASEAIKTGAATKGAATQTGVAATAGITEVGTSAAVAAAGAYKSTVVIPFIGPIAAPAAAALALATVLGFGALISAKGGQAEVGQDGQLSMLHKKEMVLPAWAAIPLREGLKARGNGSMMSNIASAGSMVRESVSTTTKAGDTIFNYDPKHTNMGASMSQLLREDGRTMRKWIKEQVRNGGLSFR
jgi:hypothetical protein